MKQDKPVLKFEAEMQNLEQVKELLTQIATLQRKYTGKYTVDLKINMYPCTSNLLDALADRLRSKESEISGKATDTRKNY